MPKRVAILQSNYIPWKGYFDIIHDVDEFIFHDDLQFTKQDWRNRNRIKTASGPAWLTIPVGSRENRLICEVALPAGDWARRHWHSIRRSYSAAPHFPACASVLEELWLNREWKTLSALNQHIIRTVAADLLGIRTSFRDSREFGLQSRKQDRVLDILERTGADVYVSGPAARAYLEPARFAERGIELQWKDYGAYPEYPQLYPPFLHEVTILDLLFHVGPDAPRYIWGAA
jgi:hypothetical protein